MKSNIDELIQKIVDVHKNKIFLSGRVICDYLVNEYENQEQLYSELLTDEENEMDDILKLIAIKKIKDYLFRNWHSLVYFK